MSAVSLTTLSPVREQRNPAQSNKDSTLLQVLKIAEKQEEILQAVGKMSILLESLENEDNPTNE